MFKTKKTLLFCLLLTTIFCAKAATITVKINNPIKDVKTLIQLNSDNEARTVKINEKGEGSIVIDNNEKAQYAIFVYKMTRKVFYFTPNQDISISFNAEKYNGKIVFGGKNAAINNYLNANVLQYPDFDRTTVTDQECIAKLDSLYDLNCQQLKKAKLSKEFSSLETLRLKYDMYSFLATFYDKEIYADLPFNPSEKFFNKLDKLAVIDANLLTLNEYKYFIKNAIAILAIKNNVNDKKNKMNMIFDYIQNNIKDPKIAELLVYSYSMEAISNNGIGNSDRIVSEVNTFVKDEALKTNFKAIYDKWAKIKSGNPSPVFSLLDINGKKVSLNDLKGKIVYIDIWATWCGPCCKELPHLKTLEEKYGDKDIYFVSISCDKNKKIWEQMVQKKELKGVQLHFADDPNFLESYMVRGIPRFILIDREGKIIDADTTRPSDPKTVEKLNQLLAK